MIGIICSEPLLEDKEKFPDTAFTASQSLDNHDAPKARLSSNSSWCAPPDGSHYLQVDLGRVYVINSVTTFGDSSSANWVTSYKLTYTSDGIKWTEKPAAAMKVIFRHDFYFHESSLAIGTVTFCRPVRRSDH